MKIRAIPGKLLMFLFRQKKKEPPKEGYHSQITAIPYLLAPVIFLALQSVSATIGALDLVVTDLPVPIPIETGRAFHLNLSVLWPLLGSMGASYYFFVEEAQTELYSMKLATAQFWIFILTTTGILLSLMLGQMHGMEYNEAAFPFHFGIAITLILFFYNLLRTYLKTRQRGRITILSILSGAALLLLLYLPNLINYNQPTISEIFRFWVIHLWEELSKELLLLGALAAFLLKTTSLQRAKLEKILFLQLTILIIGAIFATGHHYYWIGMPTVWQWIGGIFSVVQFIGLLLLLYILYLGLAHSNWNKLDYGEKLTFVFIAAGIFYHIMGAAVLGMVIAVPQINRYSSATYLTSAHAHLAVYGAIGMLVLAFSVYALTRKQDLTSKSYFYLCCGFGLNNCGLLIMGTVLTLAGFLQTYLIRVAGLDFQAAQTLIRPYLLLRAGGGATFALGAFLFSTILVYHYCGTTRKHQ
ncbi:MAG: hypothetical protein GX893_06115 [Firmicutes bacterium]|nr:hypothetical protein [Bacillota bacterium]